MTENKLTPEPTPRPPFPPKRGEKSPLPSWTSSTLVGILLAMLIGIGFFVVVGLLSWWYVRNWTFR
jgi:hypothetical protein